MPILAEYSKITKVMNKKELSIEKRLNKAVVASSMTLKAQLKALNTDAGYKLQMKSVKDGNVTITESQVTKREQIAKLGMLPKMSGKSCLGYTPATFNDATDESLKVMSDDGKVVATYCYVDRVVTVSVEDAKTGMKDYSLYTSEEADKKVKGESANTIKLYRKVQIAENGWGPGLIVKVLWQSRHIEEEEQRAAKSREAYDEAKKEGLYIVINVDGVLKKVKVNVGDVKE